MGSDEATGFSEAAEICLAIATAIYIVGGFTFTMITYSEYFQPTKNFILTKTNLSPRDCASAIVVHAAIIFEALLWPLALPAILVYQGLQHYLYTPGYTCFGVSWAKQPPSPHQEPGSDSRVLKTGLNSTASLPHNPTISVRSSTHSEIHGLGARHEDIFDCGAGTSSSVPATSTSTRRYPPVKDSKA